MIIICVLIYYFSMQCREYNRIDYQDFLFIHVNVQCMLEYYVAMQLSC